MSGFLILSPLTDFGRSRHKAIAVWSEDILQTCRRCLEGCNSSNQYLLTFSAFWSVWITDLSLIMLVAQGFVAYAKPPAEIPARSHWLDSRFGTLQFVALTISRGQAPEPARHHTLADPTEPATHQVGANQSQTRVGSRLTWKCSDGDSCRGNCFGRLGILGTMQNHHPLRLNVLFVHGAGLLLLTCECLC